MISTLADILSDGVRTLDDAGLEARLSVCRACPHGQEKVLGLTCGRCGCVMTVKARFIASKCPDGLWGEADGEVNAAGTDAPSVGLAPATSPIRLANGGGVNT